ncbi:MAG: flippase-like domain-containing protein [Actinomycetota bacterium]|nr:flippase-like domain-containing protein [Actinomycetota bacterium]
MSKDHPADAPADRDLVLAAPGTDAEPPSVAGVVTGAVSQVARRKPVRFTVKLLLFALVMWVFVLPLIPGFRKALTELRDVQPMLLAAGLGLQVAAFYSYSLLTKAALGEAGRSVSPMRMFRIQMSTKAMSLIVPGGSAAGPALGYRLLTLSNVSGPDAGFALATAALGSAVVLNLIFWIGLLVSIPNRGVNPLYGTAALAGILLMMLAGFLVFGLLEGQGRAERALRWLARKFRRDEDRTAAVIRQLGERLEQLISNRALLRRVVAWAAANWMFDAMSLWVFLRAFGQSLDVDGLIIAFGLANIVAVIPITPGGLGIVEGVYIPTLIGFGLTRSVASLGVASYRIAQLFFPILLGGILYLSLRVGPFRIERRQERLRSLRDLAQDDDVTRERQVDFVLRASRERAERDRRPADVAGESGLPPGPHDAP